MAEIVERLRPSGRHARERLGVRLAVPDDNRRVNAVRLVGDEIEADEAGRRLQLGEELALGAFDRLFLARVIDRATVDHGIHEGSLPPLTGLRPMDDGPYYRT